jgi:hypothetical protein
MVEGLQFFKEHFQDFTDSYVLIGGSACDIWFKKYEKGYRVTTDLDIILIIEALEMDFVEHFWMFIREGRYKIFKNIDGQKVYYRFEKPDTLGFPKQIELLSGKSELLEIPENLRKDQIEVGDTDTSLGAIIIDREYYALTQTGKTTEEGLSLLKPEYLILLKAKAFLNNYRLQLAGDTV